MDFRLQDINPENFNEKALEVFEFQRKNNPIYAAFCQSILKKTVSQVVDIPFLPIPFFKTHQVGCFADINLSYFESSGTSSQTNAKHYYKDLGLYQQSIELGFNHFFKGIEYTIVGLLPHYLERQHSSLVHMVRHWMRMNNQEVYFYLHNLPDLNEKLHELLSQKKEVLLIGISFALLDFGDRFNILNSKLSIIETGGMKGSRPELTKIELHSKLKSAFPLSSIISEYGMCELFSQAYSDTSLWFSCPPWMRVCVGDVTDPLQIEEQGRGPAKIIDLANLYSCSFIETQDLIELKSNGEFQLLGRMNQADARGCSLMYN